MRNRGIILLFFASLCLPGLHAGDGIRQDAGLWTNVSIAPKLLAGRWKTLYSLEYRSKEHFRETSLWCGMWNVDYVFNPCIQVGIGYEFFLNREPGGGYGPEHRYYPEAIFSYGAGAFSVNLRSRVMNTFTQWNDPHWVGRNRLKAACSIHGTPLKPFAGVEPFHEIDPVAQRFQKIRYTAGCSYVAGRQKWDIYYLREDYLSQRFVRNILAIDYNYAF